ncbi:MAG: amidohydrolase family protein [Gammaproteobacteria bacterium]|nr:amidohydrolase family protein [Gammaproteobacteria bacterium]
MPESELKFDVPPGACDTHMHFYHHRYPAAPTARVHPGDAWVDAYRELQRRSGLERVVVVQPTTYGRDNACLLDALAELGATARAVVVVDADVSDAELEGLTARGARGVRFHMLPGGVLPWDSLEPVAARVAPFGWHVQLQMNGRELPGVAARLRRLPCPLVVDHVGRFMPPVAPGDPAFGTLIDLIEGGRCWVKLSAPYESSRRPDYADVTPLARALADATPERMLWASNWPHPGQDPAPDDLHLLGLLAEWVDDAATRSRILVDNPAALYGFT